MIGIIASVLVSFTVTALFNVSLPRLSLIHISKICPIRTSGSIENGEHWNQLESSVLTENIFETELKENSITTLVIS